jgi:NMD protein affecting ribosome stability and mRNA decay
MRKCIVCKKELHEDGANMCEECYQDAVKVLASKERHENEW